MVNNKIVRKIYVLDTNVILNDPEAILKFEDRDIVIPMMVISELDSKKNGTSEVAYNARKAFRILRDLREQGRLKDGVSNGKGGKVYIADVSDDFLTKYVALEGKDTYIREIAASPRHDITKPDVIIVLTALSVKDQNWDADVILVSNDTGVQVIADYFGIDTEYYRNDRIKEKDLEYTGRCILYLRSDEELWDNMTVLHTYILEEEYSEYFFNSDEIKLFENEYVQMVHPDGTEEYGRFYDNAIRPLRFESREVFGVHARNAGQAFLLDALMLPPQEAPLVIVQSPAGSGKTFLTLAVALEKLHIEGVYEYILYTRSNIEFDREIGALPGSEDEKMAPLTRAAFDNLEQLLKRKQKDAPQFLTEMMEKRQFRTEAMSFIRGRSLKDVFLFVDEAQNCSVNQIIGIATRPGENTKVVLAGDPDQIDNKYLERFNNGLSFAAERFHRNNSKLCIQVTLFPDECTRSPLASEAARILHR